MNRLRRMRLLCVATIGLLLAGCAGLPTGGPPNPGLAIGEEGDPTVFTPTAEGPQQGDSPEQIVKGFLEASMTPANNWEIAQEFLTDDFRRTWKPDTTVTVDDSVEARAFTPSVGADDTTATTAEVRAQFEQVAGVDAEGAFTALSKPAKATFQLQRTPHGEWRISKANDGIVLDAETFGLVYQRYALKYFDPGWTHLVPDVRWFPRRPAMATTIARALISGKPSEWLAPAVRTAFSEDMALAGDAVTVDSSQVASVALTRTALAATSADLSRMRTQLEASLAATGVSEVRFTVDGATLEAGTVPVETAMVDPGVLVLKDDSFGATNSGDELKPVGGLTAQIAKITQPIRAIDVSMDAMLASVQLRDGVYAVTAGNSAVLDRRPGLIDPSLDPFGFTWTVPRDEPAAVTAWTPQGGEHKVAKAWSGVDTITQLRVAADGARVAAVVTSGGQRRVVVAAIIRGKASEPVELGAPHEVGITTGTTQGLAWVGTDTVAVLSHTPAPALATFVVGGPVVHSPAPPDGAMTLSGAKSPTGLRVLGPDGDVYAQRGSSWQVSVEGVRVLGTRAGY